jgi:hypothetical protein
VSGPLLDDEDHRAAIVRAMQRIAVVGIKDAAADPDAPAASIPALLAEMGFEVVGINPRVPSALGQPTLPSVAELPAGVDVLDVFRRSDAVAGLADAILALPPGRRPRAVWLQSGIRDDASAMRLAAAGIGVVQDACLGVYARRYRR